MTEAQFRKELKEGLTGPYLFYGDEDYLKKFYAGRAEAHTVGADPELASWNTHIINADQSSELGELESAVLSVSMMGDKTFVRYNADLTSLSTEEFDSLMGIIGSVDPSLVLLIIVAPPGGFDPGKGKKPSKMAERLSEVCTIVDFSCQTPSELKKWMARRLAKDSLTLSDRAAELLISRCTDNMYILSGELDKLAAYSLANSLSVIDEATVQDITAATQSDDAFALTNAVLDGDRRRALKVLHTHKVHRDKAVTVLAGVSRCICDMTLIAYLVKEGASKTDIAAKTKMHEYRVGLYMNAVALSPPERLLAAAKRCREADRLLKSTPLDYIALERLICTIPAKRRVKK